MRKQLKYTIDDQIIAELLGAQNFSSKESAVFEIIKNAYDAGAENVTIHFFEKSNKQVILIQDDGTGINEDGILNQWMRVGYSNKGYYFQDLEGKTRIFAGSKGVGRFALARLGKYVEILSKADGHDPVLWISDWQISEYETPVDCDFPHGTRIQIENLTDSWYDKDVKELQTFLSRTFNDDKMKISITYLDQTHYISKYFLNPVLGINFTNRINLVYDAASTSLKVTVDAKEFNDKADTLVSFNINHFEREVDIFKEISTSQKEEYRTRLLTTLNQIGDFNATFYFSLDYKASEMERFLYRYGSKLQEKYNIGVVLYRNAFSISSFEGKRDWIGFDSRARKSPAAASHPTGAWRVRFGQISGEVNIDKVKNAYLKDLQNRQGLDENEHYLLFVQIIEKGIETFERFRQKIVRSITKFNSQDNESVPKPILTSFMKNPKESVKYTDQQWEKLGHELKKYQEEITVIVDGSKNKEERYLYDVRILNALATIGLKSSSIAHELHNDRNSLAGFHDDLITSLKLYGMWEELNLSQNTKHSNRNVPKLIEDNKKTSTKILTFLDINLEKIQKSQFIRTPFHLTQIMNNIKGKWEYDYTSVSIGLENEGIGDDIEYYQDILNVIFDNLILNSIQQNARMSKHLEINISYTVFDSLIKFIYVDNGKGLDEKYNDDPFRIIEVHETTRPDGHGLGMWMVNNSITFTNGEITHIGKAPGFRIEFYLGR